MKILPQEFTPEIIHFVRIVKKSESVLMNKYLNHIKLLIKPDAML